MEKYEEKKAAYFWTLSKRGRGVQPKSKSFGIVFWAYFGHYRQKGKGVNLFQKFWSSFRVDLRLFYGTFQVVLRQFFKASALWADAFYKSKCPSVRLSVCPSVCSLLRYRLTVFLAPLPEVGCPIFLEIRNPLGKVMERSGLRYEHFYLKIVLNRRAKKSFFFLLILRACFSEAVI